MSKVFQIALNTFRESVRDKVLYVIVFFAVAMMIASRGLGWVSVGEEVQIVQHFSLAVVSFFGALISVFVGTGLIYKEIDKRTIYTILSKPVYRWQFVLGKYLGLLAVMACIVIGMGAIASGFVYYSASVRGAVDQVQWVLYWQAAALIFFEIMVVTALAIFFSTVSSPILAAIFTFTAYLVGQVTPSLIELMEFQPQAESVAHITGESLTDFTSQYHFLLHPLSKVFYHILPNLTHFQLRDEVVYGTALSPGQFGLSVGYAFCYSAAVLLVAMLCFDRRRF